MNNQEPIFAKKNKYGYKYNVNHPIIRKHYEAFKRKYNILIPSDNERMYFEKAIDKMLERGKKQ